MYNMTGKWIGSYRYSSRLMQNLIPQNETGFEITINEFDGIHFAGTVQDDAQTGGTPGTGVINGHMQENRIEFIKEMPVRSSYSTNGKRIIEEGKKHPKIFYSGILEPDKMKAKGVWQIKMGFSLIGWLPALILPTKGEWTMELNNGF